MVKFKALFSHCLGGRIFLSTQRTLIFFICSLSRFTRVDTKMTAKFGKSKNSQTLLPSLHSAWLLQTVSLFTSSFPTSQFSSSSPCPQPSVKLWGLWVLLSVGLIPRKGAWDYLNLTSGAFRLVGKQFFRFVYIYVSLETRMANTTFTLKTESIRSELFEFCTGDPISFTSLYMIVV